MREGVLAGIGGFGALFEVPKRYREPVLVSGTDGVGTKLRLAFEWGAHDTVGIDLVAMSVNDVLVQGAEPLFFLDYFACGKLDVDTAARVVGGIARGCEESGCALIGGETAEMPGMYPPGEYDLAGFCVGAVEKSGIVDGRDIVPGDVVLGLASSGVHSNGYSLVRKIVERAGASGAGLPATLDGVPFRERVMAPTRLYVKPVLAAMKELRIKGMSHITGGGLVENIPRCLPDGHEGGARQALAGRSPEIFDWLQREGGVAEAEMHRTFNCGIGFVLIVAAADAERAEQLLRAHGQSRPPHRPHRARSRRRGADAGAAAAGARAPSLPRSDARRIAQSQRAAAGCGAARPAVRRCAARSSAAGRCSQVGGQIVRRLAVQAEFGVGQAAVAALLPVARQQHDEAALHRQQRRPVFVVAVDLLQVAQHAREHVARRSPTAGTGPAAPRPRRPGRGCAGRAAASRPVRRATANGR